VLITYLVFTRAAEITINCQINEGIIFLFNFIFEHIFYFKPEPDCKDRWLISEEVRYKPLSGKLRQHFGFKLASDGKTENGVKVYCVHCNQAFVYHGSNTSLTYLRFYFISFKFIVNQN
jgi:hypothetical protein